MLLVLGVLLAEHRIIRGASSFPRFSALSSRSLFFVCFQIESSEGKKRTQKNMSGSDAVVFRKNRPAGKEIEITEATRDKLHEPPQSKNFHRIAQVNNNNSYESLAIAQEYDVLDPNNPTKSPTKTPLGAGKKKPRPKANSDGKDAEDSPSWVVLSNNSS